jgi:hypothetical protein
MIPTPPKINIATLLGWTGELGVSCDASSLINSLQNERAREDQLVSAQLSRRNLNLKVIDCSTRAIVVASEGDECVTLSYTWGSLQAVDLYQPETTEELHERPALPSILSATIEDSITLCVSLGLRFLWVDRYCIPQSETRNERVRFKKWIEFTALHINNCCLC